MFPSTTSTPVHHNGTGPRPRAVRGAMAVLLVVAALCFATVAGPAKDASAATPSADAWAFLTVTNQARAQHGLAPLRMQPTLVDFATNWTAHMVQTGSLVHNAGLGSQVAGAFPDWRGWAENIGYGSDVNGLQASFMASPGHAANVLGDYNYIGIATARDQRGLLWVTLDFMKLDRAVATLAPISTADATALVKASYVDFFHRNPSSQELQSWVAALTSGALDQGGFLQAVVTSPEWVSQLVTALYQDTLGRQPDPAGLNFWVGQIRAGLTPAAAAANFYGSAEYFSRSGGTNDSFVRSLYTKLLGRSADSGGLAYWTGRLNRGEPRSRIAYEFYQSVESRGRRVTGLYQQLLGRSPDAAGLRYWIGQLGDGNDLRLALVLAISPEYLSRARARY